MTKVMRGLQHLVQYEAGERPEGGAGLTAWSRRGRGRMRQVRSRPSLSKRQILHGCFFIHFTNILSAY